MQSRIDVSGRKVRIGGTSVSLKYDLSLRPSNILMSPKMC